MRKYHLLSVFQYAIVMALFIICATTFYALGQNKQGALPQVQSELVETGGDAQRETISAAGKVGRQVWNDNGCGACHIKNMRDDGTGPALGGVTNRWAGEPREHLYRWVRNSQALIASGESARAVAVYAENDKKVMSSYTHLGEEDVEAILTFIEEIYGRAK